jgi:hypothetical protein
MSQDPAVKAGFRFYRATTVENQYLEIAKSCIALSHHRLTRWLDSRFTGSELMQKPSSPKLSPSNFDPEMVSMMRSVLDTAVGQIELVNRTPATKANMAERILRAASDGVTDNEVLTAIAIQDGKQPAD